MRYHRTRYRLNGCTFNEEVAATDDDGLLRKLAERGLNESPDLEWFDVPSTESAVKQFDQGDYLAAAHGACQLLRLQNDSRKALRALEDHGLVHMLIHLSIFPDEPVVTGRRQLVRDELAELEFRIRALPGLNT